MCCRSLKMTSLTLSLMSFCLLSGCEPAYKTAPISVGERCLLGAYLSLSVVGRGEPGPGPTPSPSGDTCPACDGKGELGDGRVMFKCEACNGTGKVQSEVAPEPEPEPEGISTNELWGMLKHSPCSLADPEDDLITSGGRRFRREQRNGRTVYVPVQ